MHFVWVQSWVTNVSTNLAGRNHLRLTDGQLEPSYNAIFDGDSGTSLQDSITEAGNHHHNNNQRTKRTSSWVAMQLICDCHEESKRPAKPHPLRA